MTNPLAVILVALGFLLAFAAGYATRTVMGTYDECDDARTSYYHAASTPGISDAQLQALLNAATLRCGYSPQTP